MPTVNDAKIREARREYYREWRAKNPEKVKATLERFWRKKLAQAQQEQEKAHTGRE